MVGNIIWYLKSFINCEVTSQVLWFAFLDRCKFHNCHCKLNIIQLIVINIRVSKTILIHKFLQILTSSLNHSHRPTCIILQSTINLLEEKCLTFAEKYLPGIVKWGCIGLIGKISLDSSQTMWKSVVWCHISDTLHTFLIVFGCWVLPWIFAASFV